MRTRLALGSRRTCPRRSSLTPATLRQLPAYEGQLRRVDDGVNVGDQAVAQSEPDHAVEGAAPEGEQARFAVDGLPDQGGAGSAAEEHEGVAGHLIAPTEGPRRGTVGPEVGV